MARIDLNSATRDSFVVRIEGIENDAQRQWGTMAPEKLLRHLTFMFEISLGEREPEKIFMPMPHIVVWYLFFEWFTNWPKGKIEAPPAFFPEPEGAVDIERAACIAGLQRFVDALETTPERTGFSPLLGHIPLRKWARVHGVHLDHHLRQYGV